MTHSSFGFSCVWRCVAGAALVAGWIAGASAVGPVDFVAPIKSGAEMIEGDFGDGKWSEDKIEFPAPPGAADLVQINIGEATGNRFFVDERSVSVGGDGVVRYTLVVISQSGARNVSFEGMRCLTGERRLYAFGRSDGSWSAARNGRWEKIADNSLNRHHASLYREYFCTTGGSVMNTEQARSVLLRGNPAFKLN